MTDDLQPTRPGKDPVAVSLALQEALAAKGTTEAQETPRDRLWSAVWVLVVLTIINGGVGLAFYFRAGDFQEDLDKATSVVCRQLVADGVRLDPRGPCYSDDVLRWYDPSNPNRVPG